MRFIAWILEAVALVCLVYWVSGLLRTFLFGAPKSRQSAWNRAAGGGRSGSQPATVSGVMKKDPQCGTYVSTELSFKSRFRNEELHFCSRKCQEQFLHSHQAVASGK